MKTNIFFSELIWNVVEDVEVYDTQDNKLCSKHSPVYYRKKKLFEDKVVWSIEPIIKIKGNSVLTYYFRIVIREDEAMFQRKLMAKDITDLMETLASDSEKNGDGKGAYYYRSAIPYIEAYYGIKKEKENE